MSATTLVTIEEAKWERFENNYERVCQIATGEALKNHKLLLTAKEVGELTGYDEKTIKRKKNEIGFRIGFSYQDLKFKYEDVIAWINRGYIAPKPLPTHKK